MKISLDRTIQILSYMKKKNLIFISSETISWTKLFCHFSFECWKSSIQTVIFFYLDTAWMQTEVAINGGNGKRTQLIHPCVAYLLMMTKPFTLLIVSYSKESSIFESFFQPMRVKRKKFDSKIMNWFFLFWRILFKDKRFINEINILQR